MVKFLISLMFLASSWAWGAERSGSVVETKDDSHEVTLISDESQFKVAFEKLAPFKMLRAGFVANGFEESHSGLMQLDHEVINKLQYDFLKLYLEDSEAALASLASYSGNQIVDIMMMLEYLNADSNSLEIQELNSVLINQLKNKLTPEVLQRLYQALGHIPGINLSQTVPGTSASWSPDGSKLWVNFMDNGVSKIQLYQVATDRLVAIGAVVPGLEAGWSPDGSKLWVNFTDNGVVKTQIYQVTAGKLVAIGAAVTGTSASWSPDGSKLWVNFKDHGVFKIQLYQVAAERLVAVGAAVSGLDVGFSSDESRLWVHFYDHGAGQIQLYQVTADRLVAVGAAVPGYKSGFSSDGSRLWVNFMDQGVLKIRLYQVTAGGLVAVGAAIPGWEVGLNLDGSKLLGRLIDNGVPKIQLYQVTDEGLEVVGVVVPGFEAGFSSDGSKLWVSFYDNVAWMIQIYQVTAGGLVAMGAAVLGFKADLSPDGSRLWVRLSDHDVDQIQLYQVAAGELVAVGAAVPGDAEFSSDGSKLSISNNELNQITVYLNLSLMDLDQLLKQFIPNNVLYQNLNFGQQMLLIYILSEHQRQRTGVTYNLPVGLKEAWSFLPDKLKSYLLKKNIVIVNWPTVRSHDDSKVD